MKLLKTLTRPVRDLANGVLMPLRALFVVTLCGAINWATFHGEWWVKWVALGMGIAVAVALARAVRTLGLLALAAWGARWLARRHAAAWRPPAA